MCIELYTQFKEIINNSTERSWVLKLNIYEKNSKAWNTELPVTVFRHINTHKELHTSQNKRTERLSYIKSLIREHGDVNTLVIADENLLRTLHGTVNYLEHI